MAIESIALESLKSKEKKKRVKERLYVRVCEKKRENVQWKLHIRFVDVKMHKRDMNLYITCFRWLVYAFYFLPVTLHPTPSRAPSPFSRREIFKSKHVGDEIEEETVTGQAAIYLTKSLPAIDLSCSVMRATGLIGGGW